VSGQPLVLNERRFESSGGTTVTRGHCKSTPLPATSALAAPKVKQDRAYLGTGAISVRHNEAKPRVRESPGSRFSVRRWREGSLGGNVDPSGA